MNVNPLQKKITPYVACQRKVHIDIYVSCKTNYQKSFIDIQKTMMNTVMWPIFV